MITQITALLVAVASVYLVRKSSVSAAYSEYIEEAKTLNGSMNPDTSAAATKMMTRVCGFAGKLQIAIVTSQL